MSVRKKARAIPGFGWIIMSKMGDDQGKDQQA